MPRPRGPHGKENSTVVAIRVPKSLHELMVDRAGGPEALTEWHRNVLRAACRVPLDFRAGYEEGKMQGWAEASAKFREAMKGARA